jgi:hypothetical protein
MTRKTTNDVMETGTGRTASTTKSFITSSVYRWSWNNYKDCQQGLYWLFATPRLQVQIRFQCIGMTRFHLTFHDACFTR